MPIRLTSLITFYIVTTRKHTALWVKSSCQLISAFPLWFLRQLAFYISSYLEKHLLIKKIIELNVIITLNCRQREGKVSRVRVPSGCVDAARGFPPRRAHLHEVAFSSFPDL